MIAYLGDSIPVYLCNWQLNNMVLEELHIFFIVCCFEDQVDSSITWKCSTEKLETRCSLGKMYFIWRDKTSRIFCQSTFSKRRTSLLKLITEINISQYGNHYAKFIVIPTFLPEGPRGQLSYRKTRNNSGLWLVNLSLDNLVTWPNFRGDLSIQ